MSSGGTIEVEIPRKTRDCRKTVENKKKIIKNFYLPEVKMLLPLESLICGDNQVDKKCCGSIRTILYQVCLVN